jgi:hypothetical protein
MTDWQMCNSEEAIETYQHWVSMPHKEMRYIAFYVKFEKETEEYPKSGDSFLIKSEEEFVGLMIPTFEHKYPKIYAHLCESLDEHFVRPIVDEIRNNVNHSLAAILSGNIVVAMAVFEISISENDTSDSNFFACIERFRSMSCLDEQQLFELGVFN